LDIDVIILLSSSDV